MNEGYVKLKDLVGHTFDVKEVSGYVWKKWDAESKKMLVSDSFVEGYRKTYPVKTDQGRLDLGSGQLGNLLEAVLSNGKADLIDKTFEVKSNGKEGMDIRYFFNVLQAPKIEPPSQEMNFDGDVDLSSIPF